MGIRPCGAVLCTWLVMWGCGRPFPDDPEGATAHVEQTRILRAGITEHVPHTMRGADEMPRGEEAELVTRLARAHGAEVVWQWGQQEALFHALERHELDLVAGGIHEHTPWADRLALTRPWREEPDPLVLALPPGENRWLLQVERFLGGEARR